MDLGELCINTFSMRSQPNTQPMKKQQPGDFMHLLNMVHSWFFLRPEVYLISSFRWVFNFIF